MKIIEHSNESLKDLMELCLSLDQDRACAFRGQSDFMYGLTPGVYREILETLDPPYSPDDDYEWLGTMERDIYRDFIDKSRNLKLPDKLDDKWLNLFYGQHHGLPTRLLDWTTDFFVAIYFAVADNTDKDGALWHVNLADFPHPKELGRLPTNNAFRIEAVRNCVETARLAFFVPQSRVSFTDDDLAAIGRRSALPSDQSGDSRRSGFLTFLFSPYVDERIKNQKGIFSIYLTNQPTDIVIDHADYVERLEEVHGLELLTKIKIPAVRKNSIRRDLQKTGKDPFSIYPDISGLVSLLKNQRQSHLEYYRKDRKTWKW